MARVIVDLGAYILVIEKLIDGLQAHVNRRHIHASLRRGPVGKGAIGQGGTGHAGKPVVTYRKVRGQGGKNGNVLRVEAVHDVRAVGGVAGEVLNKSLHIGLQPGDIIGAHTINLFVNVEIFVRRVLVQITSPTG